MSGEDAGSRRGRRQPWTGGGTYDFAKFPKKLHEIEKMFGRTCMYMRISCHLPSRWKVKKNIKYSFEYVTPVYHLEKPRPFISPPPPPLPYGHTSRKILCILHELRGFMGFYGMQLGGGAAIIRGGGGCKINFTPVYLNFI